MHSSLGRPLIADLCAEEEGDGSKIETSGPGGMGRVLRLRMMILESFGFLGREKLVEETKIFFFNRDLDRENARTRELEI